MAVYLGRTPEKLQPPTAVHPSPVMKNPMPWIATKQFVSTFPCNHDFHLSGSLFGYKESRNHRGVSYRLIVCPCYSGQRTDHIRLRYENFAVVRRQPFRHN